MNFLRARCSSLLFFFFLSKNEKPIGLKKLKISRLADKPPIELFSVVFENEIVSLLLEQSLFYAKQNNRHEFSSAVVEMKAFVGFLLFTGYDKLPREDMCWSLDADCNTTIILNAMTRLKVRKIKRNIHLNNSITLDKTD